MKLKYILASIAAGAALLATSCTVDEPVNGAFSDFSVEKNNITVPKAGGTATINLKAPGAWSVVTEPKMIDVKDENGKTKKDENGKKIQTEEKDKDGNIIQYLKGSGFWLTVDDITPLSGNGDATVTVTLPANDGTTKSGQVEFALANSFKSVFVNIISEGTPIEVAPASCQEVIDGTDGKYYLVSGNVTRLVNTDYGNFDITDETGTVYIYGIKNASGQYPKDADGGWASFGIELGDKVTLQGPRKNYNGTIEIVDAEVIKVEKSLFTVDPTEIVLPSYEAGDTTVTVECKVPGIGVYSSADWLKVTGYNDNVYTLTYEANPLYEARTAKLTVKGPESSIDVNVTQPARPTPYDIVNAIASPDKSEVSATHALVAAVCQRGFIATDGQAYIYVYQGSSPSPVVKVGDYVDFSGMKTTYNGVPEITSNKEPAIALTVTVESSGNPVVLPTAKDITSTIDSYTASEAEYITFAGTLKKSGNYYNVEVEGASKNMGSLTYPATDLGIDAYDGKKVRYYGFYNGLSGGKYVNIIVTSVAEFAPGSLDAPFTPSEAIAYVNTLGAGNTSEKDMYVKGKISSVKYTFSAQYGTATFNISDDGSTTAPQFTAYSVYYFNNVAWTEGGKQVAVGDEVVLCGKIMLYKDSKTGAETPETASKKAWLYSLNGSTE